MLNTRLSRLETEILHILYAEPQMKLSTLSSIIIKDGNDGSRTQYRKIARAAASLEQKGFIKKDLVTHSQFSGYTKHIELLLNKDLLRLLNVLGELNGMTKNTRKIIKQLIKNDTGEMKPKAMDHFFDEEDYFSYLVAFSKNIMDRLVSQIDSLSISQLQLLLTETGYSKNPSLGNMVDACLKLVG